MPLSLKCVLLSDVSKALNVKHINLLNCPSLQRFKKKIEGVVYIDEKIKQVPAEGKYHQQIMDIFDECFQFGGDTMRLPSFYLAKIFSIHPKYFSVIKHNQYDINESLFGFVKHKQYLFVEIKNEKLYQAIQKQALFTPVKKDEVDMKNFNEIFCLYNSTYIGYWR